MKSTTNRVKNKANTEKENQRYYQKISAIVDKSFRQNMKTGFYLKSKELVRWKHFKKERSYQQGDVAICGKIYHGFRRTVFVHEVIETTCPQCLELLK